MQPRMNENMVCKIRGQALRKHFADAHPDDHPDEMAKSGEAEYACYGDCDIRRWQRKLPSNQAMLISADAALRKPVTFMPPEG